MNGTISMKWLTLIALVLALFVAAGAAAQQPAPVPAPTVSSLQSQIASAGGWSQDAAQNRIIVIGNGGSCTCELPNPQGGCDLWVCGGESDAGEWGPVSVPRPRSVAR